MNNLQIFVPKGPLTVGWDITNRCNLMCKHCYAESNSHKISDDLPFETVKNIVDQLCDLGCVIIALAGGEPLVRKDLPKIIEYIKSKGIDVFLNTNGTLLSTDKITLLKNAGLTQVEISLDGFEKEHDFIRGLGTYTKATEALKRCQDMGLKVGIMTTLFKHNLPIIPDFIDYFYHHGVVGIGFLRFIPTGRGSKNQDLLVSNTERREIIRTIYKKREQYGEKFYLKVETPLSLLVALEHKNLIKDHAYIQKIGRGCDGGITSCHILCDGTVTFCPQMGGGNYNLNDKSIKYIWDNDPYFKILRERKLQGKCGQCALRNSCGGCRVDAFLKYNNIMAEDPGCWL